MLAGLPGILHMSVCVSQPHDSRPKYSVDRLEMLKTADTKDMCWKHFSLHYLECSHKGGEMPRRDG